MLDLLLGVKRMEPYFKMLFCYSTNILFFYFSAVFMPVMDFLNEIDRKTLSKLG